MKYFCRVKYNGSAYAGFQVQPDSRTVQSEISRAAETVFGCRCKITGCSRTDAGVHALDFCLTLEPEDGVLRVPPEKLGVAMKQVLPPDIAFFDTFLVHDGFHPRYDVIKKEYSYLIYQNAVLDPFLAGRAWHMPRPFAEDAVSRMQAAGNELLGSHDFSAFRAEGSDTVSPVRTVYSFSVTKTDSLYTLKIAADGFLYHMVRIIAGTITDVASGRYAPDEISRTLASRARS
ncbi:MAG: tRNA pseudouridine(38-40) synthase TruA, partial [Clostridia bacterium]|nr:tRNA pseudouridine(38-40) synthase TruA [Clostridia bacterium]